MADALYEVVVAGSYFGQGTINRFNYYTYNAPNGNTGSLRLLSGMGFLEPTGSPLVFPTATVAREWQDLVSNDFEFVSVYCRSIYNPLDFFEQGYSPRPVGVDTADGLSPTSAFGVRSNRIRTDIRRGSKRFAGVSEDASYNGGQIQSAQLEQLETLANSMGLTVSVSQGGNVYDFLPCIVSKEEYTTPKGNRAYQYYGTLAVQFEHLALSPSWQAYTSVRTQRSRQYGD